MLFPGSNPAIPQDWKQFDFSFKALRSYNGVLVSTKWQNGKILEVELKASKEMEIYLKNNFGSEYLYIKTKSDEKLVQAQNGYFCLKLPIGNIKLIVN